MEFHWWSVGLAIFGYYVRMFFVTAGYHRYFSHKTYSTSRVFQFLLAFMAQTSSQKGALWWAAHHRHHHKFSDMEEDVHSPKQGIWHSHAGWILSKDYNETEYQYIRDLTRFPELIWLNKYKYVPSLVYALAVTLPVYFAGYGANGLIWGFCISTVLLWHGTFTINSLSHLWGRRRYETTDTSRNNPVLALVTLGEGWHNNHHRFQAAARNGFFWYEIDITYYLLKLFATVGIVWDLRPVPKQLLDSSHESWIKNKVDEVRTEAKHMVATASTSISDTAHEVMASVQQKVDGVAHALSSADVNSASQTIT